MQVVPAHQYLTIEERNALMKKNDLRAGVEILTHWLWIGGAFLLVHSWANALTIILALLVLGGKQLACAILMHDAGHKSVFNNAKLNDLVETFSIVLTN